MGVAEAQRSQLTQVSRWHDVRRRIARVDDRIVALEGVFASGLIVVIVATVLVQVVMRYVFARPNPWTEEVSRYAFVWLSLLGASLAVKRRAHFLFDAALSRTPPAVQRFIDRSVSLLVSAMLIGLIITGSELAVAARLQRSPALDIPMIYVYAALPVASALMLIHLVAGRSVPAEGQPGWASR